MARQDVRFGPRVTDAGFGLDQESDALIRRHGGFGREQGFYREEVLTRKAQRHEESMGLPEPIQGTDFLAVLDWRQFSDAMDAACLTGEETACVGQWKLQIGYRVIAKRTRLSEWQTRRALASGLRRVWEQLSHDPNWGWLDVFIEDIERHIASASWLHSYVDFEHKTAH